MKRIAQQKQNALRFGKILALGGALAVASCITVNVNLPESAVQRAADDFVRDLYKESTVIAQNSGTEGSKEAKSQKKPNKAPAAAPTPVASPTSGKPTSWNFEIRFSSAYAQELNMQTPKAIALKQKMAKRLAETDLKKLLEDGVLCEDVDGTVQFNDKNKKAGERTGEVSKLIQEENKNREELYEEVHEANPVLRNDRGNTRLRKFFATAFQKSGHATCK